MNRTTVNQEQVCVMILEHIRVGFWFVSRKTEVYVPKCLHYCVIVDWFNHYFQQNWQRTVLDFKILRSWSVESPKVADSSVPGGKKPLTSRTDGLLGFLEDTVGRVQGQRVAKQGLRHMLAVDPPSSLLGVTQMER